MRGVVVVASVPLLLGACSWTNGGTAGMPAPGSVGADQAQAIIAAYGYGDIGPIGRSKDSGDWVANAVIDGVPYIVNVDHNGLVTAQ